MSGFAVCIGTCICCGKTFSFNPVRVPSIRDSKNVRQPVCKTCVDRANPERVKKGLPEIKYSEDAYSSCSEEELD